MVQGNLEKRRSRKGPFLQVTIKEEIQHVIYIENAKFLSRFAPSDKWKLSTSEFIFCLFVLFLFERMCFSCKRNLAVFVIKHRPLISGWFG